MGKLNNLLNFDDFKPNWKPQSAKTTKRTETGLDIVKENKINEISRDKLDAAAELLKKKGHEKRAAALRRYVSPGGVNSPQFKIFTPGANKRVKFVKFEQFDFYMFYDVWNDNGKEYPASLAPYFRDDDGENFCPFWMTIDENGHCIIEENYADEPILYKFLDRKEAVNFIKFVNSPEIHNYLKTSLMRISRERGNDDEESVVELINNVKDAFSSLKPNDLYED